MSIKQNGGVFGRNPTFNDVTIEGDLIINGEVFTGLDFQGSWNASTNSPALASSVGTNGEFYIVSIAGTTDLNGITNWGIGDWAIFNGTAWQRVEGGADGNFNDVTVAGTLEVTGEITANGGIALGDNDQATFGNGADLRIYHDGTNSNIYDAGTGDLRLNGVNVELRSAATGDSYLKANNAGSVDIAYDGDVKLATTSTGIDVTGDVVASVLKAEGTEPSVFFNDTTTGHDDWKMYADWDQFQIQQYVNDTTWTSRLHFAANGNATFSGTATMDKIIASSIGATVRVRDTSITDTTQDTLVMYAPALNTFALGVSSLSGNKKGITLTGGNDVSFHEDTGTTAKFFWDASAESLGIGTSSPSVALQVQSNTAEAGRSLRIAYDGTYYTDITNKASGGVTYNAVGATAGGHRFELDGSEKMRIDASGHAIIPAGVTLGTAAGVYSAANTLDDYETGTWTPTIGGNTSGSITGFTVSDATYTKIGDTVRLSCYLSSINMTTSTVVGTYEIGGLPFSPDSYADVVSVAYCNMFSFDESTTSISGYCGGSIIRLLKGSSVAGVTDADSGSHTGAAIMLSVTYKVA